MGIKLDSPMLVGRNPSLYSTLTTSFAKQVHYKNRVKKQTMNLDITQLRFIEFGIGFKFNW